MNGEDDDKIICHQNEPSKSKYSPFRFPAESNCVMASCRNHNGLEWATLLSESIVGFPMRNDCE